MDERLEHTHARTSTGTVVYVPAEALSEYIHQSFGWVDVTLEAMEQATELTVYINEVSLSELELHQTQEIDHSDNSPAVFYIAGQSEEIFVVVENIKGKIHAAWNHVDDINEGRPLISDLIEAEQDIDEEKKELRFDPSEKFLMVAVA